MKNCSVLGCCRPARNGSANHCNAHYLQIYIHGKILKAHLGRVIKRKRTGEPNKKGGASWAHVQ